MSDNKIHFSNLKHILKSPAHYVNSLTDRDDTRAFRIGRAVHAYILQGIEPTVYDGTRRGKEWDAYLYLIDKTKIEKEDILNAAEYNEVIGMVNAIKSSSIAMSLLDRCTSFEKEIEWTFEGVECAGRVDAFGSDILVELKTCASSHPKKFLSDANKFLYHAQMAWYDTGLGTVYNPDGTKWREHYIIAVETSAPNCVTVFKLDDLRIDQGLTICHDMIEKYKACMTNGDFTAGYVIDQPVIWDADIIIDEGEEEL